MLHWLRHNWIAVVFIVAVVASFYLAREQSASLDNAQRTQLVKGCKRTSARTAVLVYAEKDVAEARYARGEYKAGGKADEIAHGLLITIPGPSSLEEAADREALASVVPALDSHDHRIYKPSPDALALQAEGCKIAYR